MNFSKHALWVSAILFALLMRADAQETTQLQSPPKYKMDLVRIIDTEAAEYIFVIGNLGFKSVDSLKTFLGSLPPGSDLEWAPGCRRMGNEPLLSSEQEMEDFKQFCRAKNIRFVLIPSG